MPDTSPTLPSSSSDTPRTVLVTGAGRRLGREVALTLARAGWQVAVHFRRSLTESAETVRDCRAIAGAESAAQAFEADLSDEASVRALVPAVVGHFGRLDALVNNASLFEQDSAADFGFASLERHMRSNAGAPVLLAQALAEHVVAREGAPAEAAVVNLLDQKLWNQNPDFFSYTLSKAALEAATTMLALALAPRVRVVGVAPGLTLTSHLLDEATFHKLHTLSPLGRSSTPDDVAGTVRFALETRSITGTTLLVDGGQHLQRFDRDFSLM
ncbi:SDR family oxidoreductase [Xylophilus sp. GOD-11R]|uniref:SDR family oxidoreductase n=1 Tax=Xylophilus sp. GOD-11R TaxID=3089814 RepID=UPI00298D09C4|nr:SDR family oxidoreductase [Xylophilus sp. GOD-11R]WPB56474.1 SDR family oxidoreductase [Xylophilus sp. GOD-11R]